MVLAARLDQIRDEGDGDQVPARAAAEADRGGGAQLGRGGAADAHDEPRGVGARVDVFEPGELHQACGAQGRLWGQRQDER